MSAPTRKRSAYDLCPAHKGLGGGRETARMACMGGPYGGPPCHPRPCRILPGRDHFAEGVTDAELVRLVAAWAVNRATEESKP